MLVVLLFRLNILILSREGQEKKFLAGAPAPASLPLSPPLVAGAFQITFLAKMHANDFFYFLKIIFDISTSKRSKTYKPY